MGRTTQHLGSNIKESGTGVFSSRGSQGKNQSKITDIATGRARRDQAKYQKKLTEMPRFPLPAGSKNG